MQPVLTLKGEMINATSHCDKYDDRYFKKARYLEIRLFEGTTFNAVRAKEKTGLDPHFLFDRKELQAPEVRLYETSSDSFFSLHAAERGAYDMIFLDGLYTFDQTLRDFHNALNCLSPHGIIVIDDVCPSSYLASIGDMSLISHI